MRNNLILHDKFEKAFLKIAFKEGFVKPNSLSFGSEIGDVIEQVKLDFYDVRYKNDILLQMLLLHDKITLTDNIIPFSYDLSKLKNTGLIDDTSETEYLDISLGYIDHEKLGYDFLLKIKPIILEKLKHETFKEVYEVCQLKERKINFREFLSITYDYYVLFDFEPSDYSEKRLIVFSEWDTYLNSENYFKKFKDFAEKSELDEDLINKIKYSTYLNYISGEIGNLLTLLELSDKENGVLMQNSFNFDKFFGKEGVSTHSPIESKIESMQILKISHENIIGSLPKLESFNDVLRLKDKKHKQIKQLREVIYEIEHLIRTEGNISAAIKTEKLLKKATDDLNKNEKIDKVDRWLTYLSIPVGLVETMNNLPPVLGISMNFASLGTTLKSYLANQKNGWLQVIR